MNRGVLYAIGAYGLWGFLPLYWKAVQTVPAVQILSHRFVWSCIFLMMLIWVKKEWPVLRGALATPRTLAVFSLAAVLLAINWLTYIWGVNAGFIVESSLGYFINPLMNVLLGVVFFKERLRPWQWGSIGLAGAGVLYLTLSYGRLPWIALVLAFTFGMYGLLKKTAPLGALPGLTLETAILFVPAGALLLFAESQGSGAFGHQGLTVTTLLAFTGVITALPLLLFAGAARRIHLSTLGLLQYIAPTIQFLIGVLVYGEPFTQARLVGFGAIWVALALYSLEGFVNKGLGNRRLGVRTM